MLITLFIRCLVKTDLSSFGNLMVKDIMIHQEVFIAFRGLSVYVCIQYLEVQLSLFNNVLCVPSANDGSQDNHRYSEAQN